MAVITWKMETLVFWFVFPCDCELMSTKLHLDIFCFESTQIQFNHKLAIVLFRFLFKASVAFKVKNVAFVQSFNTFALYYLRAWHRLAECRTTVPLKFVTIIHNYANVWMIKKLLPGFLVITSLYGINNDWSIQTCLPEQATRRYVWNSGCFAVQQHFPEANSKFEENEEMLNSEMEGGGVGDKSP